MVMPEEKKPVFDDRVEEILKALERGRTREELASLFGYSTWKSLDIYMRRRNFTWDARAKTYVPAHTRVEEMLDGAGSDAPTKVALIVKLFAKDGADPRTVARQVGMKEHRELAEYMRIKGYEWSLEENNYVKRLGELSEGDSSEAKNPSGGKAIPEWPKVTALPLRRTGDLPGFEGYLPLLELLERNKERLLELLSPASATGKLPRYAVPGTTKTKSVFMSDLLSRLVAEFSESKNISQREIVEGAIVEYLSRYGFQREIEALLRQS